MRRLVVRAYDFGGDDEHAPAADAAPSQKGHECARRPHSSGRPGIAGDVPLDGGHVDVLDRDGGQRLDLGPHRA